MSTAHDAAEPVSRSLPAIAGFGMWIRALPFTLAALGLLFFANSAGADEDNDGPVRFHEVNAWRGTLVASARANPATMSLLDQQVRVMGGKKAYSTFEFNAFVSVDFVLDEYESDPSVWTGKVTGSEYSAGYYYFAHLPELRPSDPDWKAYAEIEWSYEANGALNFKDDSRVELQFHRQRGWSVRMPSGRLPTEVRSYYFRHAPTKEEQNPEKDLIIDQDTTRRETIKVTATGMGGTGTHPYPKTVSVLLGSNDNYEGSFPLIYGLMGPAPDVIWDYTVYLEPTSLEELRLVIDEPTNYAIWRPETTLNTGAGPVLEVTARVETAKGGVPKTTVEQFVWELVQTSKEPGVALNWPLEAKDTRFDLDLDATGDYFKLSNENQKLERVVQQGFTDTVKVVPYDWGGWSTLQVTAIMSDGRLIKGKLKGKSDLGLRVPKRKPDSHIADGWKAKNKSGPDDLDDDNEPSGDGTKGDGLTLYEEYRGFYVAGQRVECKPKTKDYFVDISRAGFALPGVERFRRNTRLDVHQGLSEADLPPTRVINANHKLGAHKVDQHAIVVRVGSEANFSLTVGGPGNPKMISSVDLIANAGSDAVSTIDRKKHSIDSIVAHELGHTVNIWHHGETDPGFVRWTVSNGSLYEGSEKIEVQNQAGVVLTDAIIAIVNGMKRGYLQGWRAAPAEKSGQHSGNDSCMMRYWCAQTFEIMPGWRMTDFNEPIGDFLCSSPQGTGINDSGGLHGQAATNRGACNKQILVTDEANAPKR